MSQKQPIPSKNDIKRQLHYDTPDAVIDVIINQMERCEDARNRIENEGLVVRDTKGVAIAHPAIAIEMQSQKMICELMVKHRRK